MARLPPFFALRALEAAARRRSYSRAAEELSVTHSAVSQHIRTLEAELGARLFERRGNRMQPTPEALRLAGEVARATEVLRKGVDMLSGAGLREPLTLSVGGFMGRRWLPPRLARLMAHPAGANLEIRVDNRHVDPYRDNIDIDVRSGSGRWEGLEARRLFGETMFPVCSPRLAQTCGLRRHSDLVNAPLLHRPARPWSAWFDHFGLETPTAQGPVFDDPMMLLGAAVQGLGVALVGESLAESLADDDLAAGRLVRPVADGAFSGHSIYMVWRPDSPKLSRIHDLRDWLLAEIEAGGEIPGGGPAMTARLPPFFALRALEAAARRESYSRAAEELSVTHSAVSQHIRALEAEFGLRLFQRRGNRMEPTPPALRLAAEVARAVNILQGGVNAFAGAPARQPLILSIGGYFARRWLPPRLPRLLAHPAGAQLDIRVENRHVDLLTEDIDVGVRYGSGRWEGLEAQRLFGEALFPVCSPALALDYDLRQTEDLLRTPLLHRPGRPWSLWFDRFGLSAPVPSGPMFDDPVMLLEAAAQGLGVALGDESLVGGLVDQDLELGRLVRPFGDSAVSDLYVYMVWRRDSRKLPRIHALRDWMVDEIEGRHALDGPPA